MPVTEWCNQYREALHGAANSPQAEAMSAYMRNQFSFLGIPAPQRRILTRKIANSARKSLNEREILSLAQLLWHEKEREFQYAACDLLAASVGKLGLSSLPQLEQLVEQKSWWDTVDSLAGKVIGPIILANQKGHLRMDELAHAPSLWLRRVAILYQLGWKTATDQERLLHNCLGNAQDQNFFIRKAIGWALRQYARSEPEIVRGWLANYHLLFSPLSRREASRHL